MIKYTPDFIDNKAIIGILRRACGCVDQRLMDHGIRVSYIVFRLLSGMDGIDDRKLRDICFLSAMHDIGAYKTEEINRMLQFETDDVWEHSIYGSLFIKYFSPLSDLAQVVLFHHTSWRELKDDLVVSDECRYLSQVLHMADRIDVGLNNELRSQEELTRMLFKGRGSRFEEDLADRALQEKFVPFTAEDIENDPAFVRMQSVVPFTEEEIRGYLQMIIFSIDFRSRHTVTHTITTTSISYELSHRMHLEERYCNEIVCGALMHDLGKIGIPTEILEYPGKLSPEKMAVMRSHVDITDRIFADSVPETIRLIALRHHEKLDGSGYPKGLLGDELSIGERIVAVADIVSALAGTRSYKEAYGKDRVISLILRMKQEGLIDPGVVDCMVEYYDEIMEETRLRCQPVLDIYEGIHSEYSAVSARYVGDNKKAVQGGRL